MEKSMQMYLVTHGENLHPLFPLTHVTVIDLPYVNVNVDYTDFYEK